MPSLATIMSRSGLKCERKRFEVRIFLISSNAA